MGGGGQTPSRRALDLRKLTSILRWMFILEMASDGSLRFRLVGSMLEEAMGTGMTDRHYSDLFNLEIDGGLAEEIYALSIVRGCGLLRRGNLRLGDLQDQNFEVLALPFSDERAMGGTVMVAAVMPFQFDNPTFIDSRDRFHVHIDDMLLLPSPSVIKPEQISPRLHDLLSSQNAQLRVLDVAQLIELKLANGIAAPIDLPSRPLEAVTHSADVVN